MIDICIYRRKICKERLSLLVFRAFQSAALVTSRKYSALPDRKELKEDVKASMPSLVPSANDLAAAVSNTPRPETERPTFGLLLERGQGLLEPWQSHRESSLYILALEAILMIA